MMLMLAMLMLTLFYLREIAMQFMSWTRKFCKDASASTARTKQTHVLQT